MNTISISNNKFNSLTKMKLNSKIYNTEGIIYDFRYKGSDKALKRFYSNSGVTFANKLYTLEMLDYYKNYLPKNFCCPDNLVNVGGEVVGFTMPKIEGINLRVLLDDEKVSIHEKIYYLYKIGEVLFQMKKIRKHTPLKQFYINDLHESNIIINPDNKDISILDLDSCRIFNNGCFAAKYLGTNVFVYDKPNKYIYNEDINNGYGLIVANENSDLFCYNIMVLNFLYQDNVHRMNLKQFYEYLNYLNSLNFNLELLDCFSKIGVFCDNDNPFKWLDSLSEEQVCKARENVYKLNLSK